MESLILELVESKPSKNETERGAAFLGHAEHPHNDDRRSVLSLERLAESLPEELLQSIPSVLESLEAALIGAGLKKSSASTFAEEVLAALLAEQVIQLRGGLAVDVARSCAMALAGEAAFRIAVPLGLPDSTALRQAVASMDPPADRVSSVVFECVNHTSADVTRDVLLDLATSRIGSVFRQRHVLVFATISDASGSLPIEHNLLEAGPIFDLEHMEFRRLRHPASSPTSGTIDIATWVAATGGTADVDADYEEAVMGAQRFGIRRNARFETNVVRAYGFLQSLRRGTSPTALQSLTFGWLAPYWCALAVAASDIDAQIDGGKCDGQVIEERLRSLLREQQRQSAEVEP